MEQSIRMRRAIIRGVASIVLIMMAGARGFAQAPAGSNAYYEFILGLHLEGQGNAQGAIAAYQRAEKIDPRSAEIPAALAELYARMNRSSDAIAAAERALKINQSNSEANWILGSLYARMSELPNTPDRDRRAYADKAVANLEQADRNAHPGVPLMLGRLYLATRQFDKATALLVPYIAEEPDQVEAISLLAEAYQETDREDDAIALLEKSVSASPELFTALAQAYEDAGRWGDAAKAYEGAIGERPQSLALRTQWAKALLNAGDAPRARQVLEEGAAANSKNAPALYLLAEAQRRIRDFAAAETTARRLIALDARDLRGQLQLAQILKDQNEHQKIVALLEPLVTARFRAADAADLSSATFRSVYFELASAYENLRQFDKAIGVLTQARTLSPTDPMVPIRLARTQLEAGKGDNAVATLQTAVTKFPDQLAVKLELGSTLDRQKKYSEADALFREILTAEPKNADALNTFGYMLAERGQRLDESITMVQRALELDPGNPAYLDSLGWAYYKQNKFDLAEAPLRQAAEKLPSVSVIQSHLGDLLNKRGLYQEAIVAWQAALDGDGDSISRADLDDKIRSARQRLGKQK
jgi:tetratricopeptide (TPR) repeat protein